MWSWLNGLGMMMMMMMTVHEVAMRFSVILIFASVASAGADGAKILALFAFPSKSHFVMLEALAKGLAAKGHQITVVGHFPQKTPIPNYTDISLAGTVKQFVNNVTVDYIYERWRNPWSTIDFVWREAGVEHCELTYKNEVFQDLIRRKDEYDLLITELWGSDCFLPLAKVFQVPHISLITTMEVPWSVGRYGSPLNPAHQVNHFFTYSPRGMTFLERLMNTVYTAIINMYYPSRSEILTDRMTTISNFPVFGRPGTGVTLLCFQHQTIFHPPALYRLPSEEVVRKYLGSSYSLSEIARESSLLFVNSHFSLIGPRPFVPNIIEVGGLHITEPKPLPEDIKKFLDEAKEGAILFSFGSLIRTDSLKQEILDIFVEQFRSLPQKVLWKINGPIRNRPENVKTVEWLPQSDVLRHPNVKLFITHGGLMGTQEAVTAGVPMLGIPFFADQRFNVLNYQELGFAINLELEEITTDSFAKALRELLNDPRYPQNAKHYSHLFTDRPQTPLETAIYWTEYVIRHKGAQHMQSPAAKMNFFQYYLLDVLAVIFAPTIYIVVKCVMYLKRILMGRYSARREERRRLEKKRLLRRNS